MPRLSTPAAARLGGPEPVPGLRNGTFLQDVRSAFVRAADGWRNRAARHREWLERFGFSADDWERIKVLARQVGCLYTPGTLSDHSVPIRVAACARDEVGRFSGRLLGSCGGRALLYWKVGEREMEAWARTSRL